MGGGIDDDVQLVNTLLSSLHATSAGRLLSAALDLLYSSQS